jgi:hypothetical protein
LTTVNATPFVTTSKKDAVLQKSLMPCSYGKFVKRTLAYRDSFDLMYQLTQEGRGAGVFSALSKMKAGPI